MKILSMSFLILLSLINLSMSKLPPNYEIKSAEVKQEILWNNSIKSTYSILPNKNPGVFESMALLSSKWLLPSFTHESDEIPNGRKKLIHTYGSVARVEWIANSNHEFTGIFSSGAVGLVRLSLARQGGDFIPGMGIKLFRDSVPSVNLHVMNRLEGQGNNRNFFQNKFTNNIPDPQSLALKILAEAFSTAVEYLKKGSSPMFLPVGHLAKRNREGEQEEYINFPEVLEFMPTQEVQLSSKSKVDTRLKFLSLNAGSVIYTIWAKETKSSNAIKIGKLVLESKLITSKYGDEVLFFQHNIY